MDINRRLLSSRLRRIGAGRLLSSKLKLIEVGGHDGLDKMRASSCRTLGTVDETVSFAFNSKSSLDDEEAKMTSDDGASENSKNILESFPSLEWAQKVDQLKSLKRSSTHEKRRDAMKMMRQTFASDSRIIGYETKSEAFDNLQMLDEISTSVQYNKNTLCVEKRLMLRARESQLRRRIYSLQGISENSIAQ